MDIGYDNGLGVDINSTLNLKDHIRPIPSDASLDGLRFYSSNPSIARIDSITGEVTEISIGDVYITVSDAKSGIREPIELYVVYPRGGSELPFDEEKWRPKEIVEGGRDKKTK